MKIHELIVRPVARAHTTIQGSGPVSISIGLSGRIVCLAILGYELIEGGERLFIFQEEQQLSLAGLMLIAFGVLALLIGVYLPDER
ncbi:MAG: hypothetical protein KDA51_17535 [Planctomycetales bacterium]|nr:hypothetical protein [Planctomycetales bacterium]